jgi:signal transduction histidine kinase
MMATNAQLQDAAVELETQAEALIEQRQIREDLLAREKLARHDAEIANRAKADFLAVMSHELRTPLYAIGGHAELIGMGVHGTTSPEQLAALERIRINQRHLLGLINTILNFSKVEAGAGHSTLRDVPVAPMLTGLDALVGPQMLAKSRRLTVRAYAESIVARADEDKLRQVMVNLLTNALKVTPIGGTVDLF